MWLCGSGLRSVGLGGKAPNGIFYSFLVMETKYFPCERKEIEKFFVRDEKLSLLGNVEVPKSD